MKEQKIWNKGMNLDILNIYIFSIQFDIEKKIYININLYKIWKTKRINI